MSKALKKKKERRAKLDREIKASESKANARKAKEDARKKKKTEIKKHQEALKRLRSKK